MNWKVSFVDFMASDVYDEFTILRISMFDLFLSDRMINYIETILIEQFLVFKSIGVESFF